MLSLQGHFRMLADEGRVTAFRQAIVEVVRPGAVVADIGTGTGVLAFFALQAGAGKVYALEKGPVIAAARRAARENGFADRIVFVAEDSFRAAIPEPVDVLITETVGGFGIDEGIVEILHDARRRFLRPGGRIVPASLALQAVPVMFESRHPFGFLANGFFGLATGSWSELAANTVFPVGQALCAHLRPLAAAATLFQTEFQRCEPPAYPLCMSGGFKIAGAGSCHGVLVFPEIRLTENVACRFFDGHRFLPTHWEFLFFPLAENPPVRPGDRLDFELTVTRANGCVWRFSVGSGDRRQGFARLNLFGQPTLKHLLDRRS